MAAFKVGDRIYRVEFEDTQATLVALTVLTKRSAAALHFTGRDDAGAIRKFTSRSGWHLSPIEAARPMLHRTALWLKSAVRYDKQAIEHYMASMESIIALYRKIEARAEASEPATVEAS